MSCKVAHIQPWTPAMESFSATDSGITDAGLTLSASKYVEQLATEPELARAVDDITVDHLRSRAQAVHAAYNESSKSHFVAAVADFAQDCITLPDWVTPRYDEPSERTSELENDWTFGCAVAEATVAGVVAIAGLTEPGVLPGGASIESTHALEVLEKLSHDLDSLAPFLFGGLCRADAGLWPSGAGLQKTLQRVCAWALAAVGRTVGYERLTSVALWEWAGHDPLWALVLAKGALALDSRSCDASGAVALLVPPELDTLQAAVAQAVLGLTDSVVAFAEEYNSGALVDDSMSIELRASQLVNHRARVAEEVVSSRILSPLVTVVSSNALAAPRLASFLVTLLQPDLREPPVWVGAAWSAHDAWLLGRKSAAALATEIGKHAPELWSSFADVASSGHVSGGFMRDVADLAFLAPVSAAQCARFVHGCLQHIVSATEDHSLVAGLCVCAANANLLSAEEHGVAVGDCGLFSVLCAASDTFKINVCGQCLAWKGLVQTARMTAFLHACGQTDLHVAPGPSPASDNVSTQPPTEHEPQQCGTADPGCGLRGLLHGAPPDLCCAIDRRLLTDPVRSPQGIAFERSVLAGVLSCNGGRCPFTGASLNIGSCRRDPELRQQAAAWIRQHRQDKPHKSKRLAV